MSELTVGGIIKHVTAVERGWSLFMATGTLFEAGAAVDWSNPTPEQIETWTNEFRLLPGETLAGVVTEYERVAAATDELVAGLDLDTAHPLPPAPWFEPGASWTVRRALLHVLAETSQHAGHADIVREAIDDAKTMG